MIVLETLDRLAEADVAVRELLSAAERGALPHRLAPSRCAAGDYYYRVGRWDEALAELETLTDGSMPVAPMWRPPLHRTPALIPPPGRPRPAPPPHRRPRGPGPPPRPPPPLP